MITRDKVERATIGGKSGKEGGDYLQYGPRGKIIFISQEGRGTGQCEKEHVNGSPLSRNEKELNHVRKKYKRHARVVRNPPGI